MKFSPNYGKRVPRSRGTRRLLPALVVAGLTGAAALPVAFAPAPAWAASNPCKAEGSGNYLCVYTQKNREQTFVVPAGITTLRIFATGATSGAGGALSGGVNAGGGAHARGDVVSADIPVGPTPGLKAGQTLYIEVGGDGRVPGHSGGGQGGWNGGGNGGTADSSGGGNGGGGGASDVRAISLASPGSLVSRILVAAGGGGGGGGSGSGSGSGPGRAGGAAGQPGQFPDDIGGGAGTQTNGGAGGSGYRTAPDGAAGTLGSGGNGAARSNGGGGGGGGGGFYGGGGGGGLNGSGGGGGGGGSDLVPVAFGGTVHPDTMGKAQVVIAYNTLTGKAPTCTTTGPAITCNPPAEPARKNRT